MATPKSALRPSTSFLQKIAPKKAATKTILANTVVAKKAMRRVAPKKPVDGIGAAAERGSSSITPRIHLIHLRFDPPKLSLDQDQMEGDHPPMMMI